MNITLPASHTVTKGPRDKSWIATVTVDVSKLSADIVANLAMHGLHQKLADAASQSKTVDEAQAAMEKAADTLIAGQWTSRSPGSGVNERDAVARIIVGAWFRDAYAKGTPERDQYNDADAAGRYAILDKIWADNEAVFAEAVDEEVAARKAKADKLAGLKVKISL